MKALISALVLVAVAAIYLLFWPVPIQPQAWTPPPAPSLSEGPYAYNEKLKDIERMAEGYGVGPEGINLDSEGSVYAGFANGDVVRFSPDFKNQTKLGNTGGRPLGLGVADDGSVFIADAIKGFMVNSVKGVDIETISTEADGQKYGFADDAVAGRSGMVYFTDASDRFGYGNHMSDLLEHGANGRVFSYDPKTQEVKTLMKGVHFANGVALGPDEAYILVNETSEYRVLRYWLKGEKAGTQDVFIDNLPGFPDNISFNGENRFWVALVAPRDAMLDKTLLPGNEWLRKVVYRLPKFLQPKPSSLAFALGLDLNGKVIANLQYEGKGAYGPITSVREYREWLYFGSLTDTAIGRLPLNKAIAGVP
ncbi:strictosidine synthase family protein [Stenotrophobium rhamnosiphilum]|uniref:Gluconolactonase n=1 Tax=Stenotrophobium rhamnosiphilum TaxID=2029166 RepID=A0A2T5MIA8_9GAMM|nr:SMP-30/gluconolactonase/LRE family protein [Stenotrophobium rhamnosiphilum]PTU32316.1 gluconolactonase [Stenotrophobium rhamnosiphilum]